MEKENRTKESPQEGPRGSKIEKEKKGADVASICHRCGIDADRCGIDVSSMWIDVASMWIDVASMCDRYWHRC